jgi:hypothetical protein
LKWHTHQINDKFDKKLVVFRERYPFHMLIKSELGKCWVKIWVATDAKEFYAYKTQVYTSQLMEQGGRSRAFDLSNIYVWSVSVWNQNR